MNIYRENILDHYRSPRNFGNLENPDVSHEEDNIFCGDKIKIDLHITHHSLRIADIKFSGEGCAIAMASASILTEKAKGKKLKDLHKLDKDDILKMLGIELSPTRRKCALLPREALNKAIEKYDQRKKNQKMDS